MLTYLMTFISVFDSECIIENHTKLSVSLSTTASVKTFVFFILQAVL